MLEYLHYIWPVIAVYLVIHIFRVCLYTRSIRKRYNELPSLPRHPVWGNLVNAVKELNNGKHPDYGFESIWNQLGQPAAYIMDLTPLQPCFLILAEPQYAELCSSPSPEYKYSLPKSDTYDYLRPMIGQESLVTTEGEEWKQIRKRFNPGFQPRHLYSLTPTIVAQTETFVSKLKDAANTGEVVPMARLTSALTIDIITEIAMQKDLGAQLTPAGAGEKRTLGILNALRRLGELAYKAEEAFNPAYRLNFTRPIEELFYEYVLDYKLSAIVAENLRQSTQGSEANGSIEKKSSTSAAASRSVIHLATTGLPVSKELIRNTAHQVKTFLFAGHDTTSTLLQWLFYEISIHPSQLSKLRAEHESVFGPGAHSAGPALSAMDASADRILGTMLPYTTAVVKEGLRLHPPAGTTRHVPDEAEGGKPVTIEFDRKDTLEGMNGAPHGTSKAGPGSTLAFQVNGLRIYPCHWLIQRNPKIWGPDAAEFNPDRWLDDEYMSRIPVGAYRPFERGPRNCIGQDLAMMEAKIGLAMVSRAFEFEKAGPGEAYSLHAIIHKPNDEMRMRVRFAE